jgi:hypothetical protein
MAEASFIIRAVDATRQAFGEIQNSLAKLKSSSQTAAAFMKKVFDPRALGTGLAAAFGISLVGAIDKAFEALSRFASKFDDIRKSAADTASEVRRIYQEAAFEAMTPEGQLADMTERRAEMEKRILELRKQTAVITKETPTMDRTGQVRMVVTREVRGTREEAAELEKLEEQYAKLTVDSDKIVSKQSVDRLKQLEDGFDQLISAQSKANDIAEANRAAEKQRVEALNEAASAQLDLLNPMREYQRQIEEVNRLELASKLTAEQAAARREQIRTEASAGINREIELLREAADAQRDILDPARAYQREIDMINKLLEKSLLTPEEAGERLRQINLKIAESSGAIVDQQVEITSEMQRMQDLARDVGDTIAGGFEDAIFSGEKLSEVLKRLALDLMRLLFQRMVTQQLAAGISTMLGFPPIPGFRANGGPVNSNAPYIVGERGPELFVPGTSGAIIPNNRMGSGGGGGGPTVNISYNIQSGVSRAELQPILEQERKRLRAEIPDMVRRGGSYRAAFA